MTLRNAAGDRSLTRLQFNIMIAVRDLGPLAYCNAIRHELMALGTSYDVGLVHQTLVRMADHDLLLSSRVSGAVARDGRKRTIVVYRQTSRGAEAVERSRAYFSQ